MSRTVSQRGNRKKGRKCYCQHQNKFFYNYAKSKSTTKSTIGPFMIGDNYINESDQKANELAKPYSSVYCWDHMKLLHYIASKYGTRGLENIQFTVTDIVIEINS